MKTVLPLALRNAKALAADAISIYPNPANNVLNIDSASELNSVRFYDVTGRMVKLIDMKGDFSRAMDVADLNNGIYILQVEMLGGGSTSSKFIKK